MMLYVVQLARFFVRTVLTVALTFACPGSGIAHAQELTAHESSAAENDSATEASKQAANPLASVWLVQFQQNNTWIGMPANSGNRVQSNLQFQPLMPYFGVDVFWDLFHSDPRYTDLLRRMGLPHPE